MKEDENITLAHRFREAGLREKLTIFWEKNPFDVSMSLVFVITYALLYYATNSVGLVNVLIEFYSHGYTTYSFFSIGLILATVSLAFYPLSSMATYVMLRRYGRFPLPRPAVSLSNPEGEGSWSEFSVEQLKGAIRLADENQASTVRLWVSSEENSTEVAKGGESSGL